MDAPPSPSLATPLWSSLRGCWEYSLDALFPPRCAGCGRFGADVFCDDCRLQLQPLEPPFCFVCGEPFEALAKGVELCADCRNNRYHSAPPFSILRSVYGFEGPLRSAVHRLKYDGKTALAAPLAQLLAAYLQTQSEGAPAIMPQELKFIVPVPLSAWRRYRRGYNQSTLLARELSRHLNIPFSESLQRTRHTPPQVGLTAAERADNVRGAFGVDESVAWDAGPVLLIDDVYTTGATIRECARVLRQNGVSEIYGLTLARQL